MFCTPMKGTAMAELPENFDATKYLDKPATALQERFVEWLTDEVGYDATKAKTKQEAFAEGVRLATACRMVFQASPFNRAANAEAAKEREARRAEAEQEEAPRPAKKAAPAKATKAAPVKAAAKATRATRAKAAPEPEPEEAEEAPKARPTRRPARRAAAATANEAPF